MFLEFHGSRPPQFVTKTCLKVIEHVHGTSWRIHSRFLINSLWKYKGEMLLEIVGHVPSTSLYWDIVKSPWIPDSYINRCKKQWKCFCVPWAKGVSSVKHMVFGNYFRLFPLFSVPKKRNNAEIITKNYVKHMAVGNYFRLFRLFCVSGEESTSEIRFPTFPTLWEDSCWARGWGSHSQSLVICDYYRCIMTAARNFEYVVKNMIFRFSGNVK